MSYVIAAPEMIAAAATDLANIGWSLSEANAAAAAPTTGVLAAAEDEVSAAIAALFSAHGQGFQALSAQAAALHAQFVQALNRAGGAYAAAEAANASPLQAVVQGARSYMSTEAGALAGLGGLIAAPAIPPISATTNPVFQGAPSLLTKIEGATLLAGLKLFFNLPPVDNELANPHSPLMTLFADAPKIPLVNLLISNKPPPILPLLLGEHVSTTNYQGMPVVQIAPAHPDGDYVVAIHGGAGILPPLLFHWIDYSMIAYQTGATVEVPIYPLVQQGGTAPTVIPKMAGFISSEVGAYGAPHVSVLGDSAGANIAMTSVEYEITHSMAIPGAMVLLSPPVDGSLSNPAIGSVTGSWLPPASTLLQIDKTWVAGLPLTSPEVSPLYGPLGQLPPTTVYSGSQDIVYPDVLRLQQAAVTQNAPISFVYAAGETHDWITITPDGVHYWPQIDHELGIR